jgi:N6-L-threonylcarbamoyladenine synthase
MKILGIESSCDETAASIVTDRKEILSNVIMSQIKDHQKYGGVVPEISSRAHLSNMNTVVERALVDAKVALKEIDAIAVTSGPGLIGGLLVGVMFAKGLSFASNIPLIGINHLEGHALTARLTNDVEFPYLMLLVSGGHCQILVAEAVGKYHKLGGTLDDAVGESFDKVAKMLGLEYPGGPVIEKLALKGDPNSFVFPQSMRGREGCDFSFSGLKTAARLIIEKTELNEENIANICASFQRTIAVILLERLANGLEMAKKICPEIKQLVIAGGVAANQYILSRIKNEMLKNEIETIAPPIKLCTDNAAMIAWAGVEYFKLGKISREVVPKSRWGLDLLG